MTIQELKQEKDFSMDEYDNDLLLGNDSLDSLDDGFDGMIPAEKHHALLQNLTNFAPFIRNQINDYLGLVWDEAKNKYTRDKRIKAIMNIQGALWLVGNLKVYARENNVLTFLRKEEFINMKDDIIDTLWFGFAPRARKEFGMKSTGDILRVCSELESACILVLSGAGEGKVMDFLGGSTKYHQNEQGHGEAVQPFGMMPQQKTNRFSDTIKKIFA